MTDDEQVAHDVKVALLKACDAIDVCARRGLSVKLDVYEFLPDGAKQPVDHVTAFVSRSL